MINYKSQLELIYYDVYNANCNYFFEHSKKSFVFVLKTIFVKIFVLNLYSRVLI